MKRWFYCSAIGILLAGSAGAQSDFWVNDGIIIAPPDIAPQVDAVTFINNNIISIDFTNFDYRPLFDTSRTLNFTNRGSMTANTGFRFDTEPVNNGFAHWASTFHNTGVISAGTDTNLLNTNIFLFSFTPSVTIVEATNIVSPGTFDLGFESQLTIHGGVVDMSRGVVAMQESGFVNTLGLFTLNLGFLDGYWGIGTNQMTPAFNFGTTPAFSPFDTLITERTGFINFQQLGGPGFVSYLSDLTDASGSNRVVRAVFLENTNLDYTVNVYFPIFGDIDIEWISHTVPTNYFYLSDTFGIFTNFALIPNGAAGPRTTFIPINYSFFFGGPLILGTPETPVVIPPGTFSTAFQTNQYSAYEALFLPTTRGLTDVPSQNITNLPGRVEISATDYLDLTLARISTDNWLSLSSSNHFGGSIGSILSSPYYDLHLRTTNGFFALTNVVQPRVPRPEGTIELYSARWTNVVAGVTNQYHVLFVDSKLATSAPTREQDVSLRVTNEFGLPDTLIINNVLNVTRSLLLDANTIVIATNDVSSDTPTGGINFLSGAILWPTSTPRLQYLTNFGFITSENAIFFGGSRSAPYFSSTFNEPYRAFVNYGGITNFGSVIWADYFQNSGSFVANNNGSILLQQSQTAILTNSVFLAPGGDILIAGNNVVVSNDVFLAGRSISIATTNFLDDGSLITGSADLITNKNTWISSSFNILAAPAQGSLLGTTVTNTAAPYQRVIDRFAGADRGCTPDGFYNNAAIGRLVLNGGVNSLFEFAGVTGGNAIYIDQLELEGFTATNRDLSGNFTGMQVDSNIKVYFGQALANGVSVAEKLNGKNGGRFCWVSSFNCGFFSSTNMLYPNGITNRINTALAQSCDLDSNGNGIVNCMDPAPVPGGGCVPPAPIAIINLTNSTPGSGGGSTGSGLGQGKSVLESPNSHGTVSSTILPNGFTLAAGNYNGLIYETAGISSRSAGAFNVKSTAKATFSAKLSTGGRTYAFSGKFDPRGRATNSIARAGATPLKVELQVDLAGGDLMQGRVTDGNWSAVLVADRQIYSRNGRLSPQAGTYTLLVAGDPALSSSSPGGCGFGTVKVDAGGTVMFSATLADGTKISQSTTLSKQGLWPMYSSLNGGKGVLMSWVQFSNQSQTDLSGQMIWLRPAGASKYYPGGFTNALSVSGSAYHAPAAGMRVLNLTQGNLVLSGGGLSQSVTNGVTLGMNNKLSSTSDKSLTLTITASSGLFKGTLLNPATGKMVPIQGAVSRKANIGVGYFLGESTSGEVYLSRAGQ